MSDAFCTHGKHFDKECAKCGRGIFTPASLPDLTRKAPGQFTNWAEEVAHRLEVLERRLDAHAKSRDAQDARMKEIELLLSLWAAAYAKPSPPVTTELTAS